MRKFHARHKEHSDRYWAESIQTHWELYQYSTVVSQLYVPGGLLMAGCMVSNVSDIVPLTFLIGYFEFQNKSQTRKLRFAVSTG